MTSAHLLKARIPCARCKHQVNQISSYQHPATMETVITAKCHGAAETVKIPYWVWIQLDANDVTWLPAFA